LLYANPTLSCWTYLRDIFEVKEFSNEKVLENKTSLILKNKRGLFSIKF